MQPKIALLKCIALLYREAEAKSDNSVDLIRTILPKISVPEQLIGMNGERDSIIGLRDLLIEMMDGVQSGQPDFDKAIILNRISLICNDDTRLYASFDQAIGKSIDSSAVQRTIVSYRKTLNAFYRENQLTDVIGKAYKTFTYSRATVNDVSDFIDKLVLQLESLRPQNNLKDPAVITEIDIGDENAVAKLFSEVQAENQGSAKLRTGWQGVNKMLQGGFRRGEFTVISALQHKYKTGLTLSLFRQIAEYNTPRMLDTTKKPMLLRISFEDDLSLNLQYLYTAIRFNETKEKVDIAGITDAEMATYIRNHLEKTGFSIKMMMVDPTRWTYKDVINTFMMLKAKGYEIHATMVDYLKMLPTTGCSTGPMGYDLQDLFRRMRLFARQEATAFITPHQLSQEAKNLLREENGSGVGASEANFVRMVSGRGYTAGCRTIDQEMDAGIVLHLFKHQKRTFVALNLEKHRVPTVIPEDDKYLMYMFPDGDNRGMPIPDDLYDDVPMHFTRLPKLDREQVSNDDIFSI